MDAGPDQLQGECRRSAGTGPQLFWRGAKKAASNAAAKRLGSLSRRARCACRTRRPQQTAIRRTGGWWWARAQGTVTRMRGDAVLATSQSPSELQKRYGGQNRGSGRASGSEPD